MDKYFVAKLEDFVFYDEPKQEFINETKPVASKTVKEKVRDTVQLKRSVSVWFSRDSYAVINEIKEIKELYFLATVYIKEIIKRDDCVFIALSNLDLLFLDFDGKCYIFPKEIIKSVEFDKKYKCELKIEFYDSEVNTFVYNKAVQRDQHLLSNKHMNAYFASLYND